MKKQSLYALVTVLIWSTMAALVFIVGGILVQHGFEHRRQRG